jgi:hypothetical protein
MFATAAMMQKRRFRMPVKKSGEQVLYMALVSFGGEDRGDSILIVSHADSISNMIAALCS